MNSKIKRNKFIHRYFCWYSFLIQPPLVHQTTNSIQINRLQLFDLGTEYSINYLTIIPNTKK